MKNQVLNIKQMQHLKELGVDISKGSMVWLPYREMKGSPEIPIELCDKYYHLEFAYSLRPILPEEEMLYTFTLQDIMQKLPPFINICMLHIYPAADLWYFVYMDSYTRTILSTKYSPDIMNAAYQMLCWVIENGHLETNK